MKIRKGFTLVEIMVIMVIIGILAALAIPSYWGVIERSRQREAVVNLGILKGAQERYALEKSAYTTVFTDLDVENFSTSLRFFNYTLGTNPSAVATATRRTDQSAVNPNFCNYNITISDTGNLTMTPVSTCARPPDP